MQENKAKSALSIPVIFEKKEDYLLDDSRFTKVKIWLMHLGLNENQSVFEKDVVDAAIDTLEYIPIVGFIEKDDSGENDFSDHRYIITKDNSGIRRKYLGHAYGVILSKDDNNAHYEDRACDDGETRTFLVVDGVIWNMFEDSANIFERDWIKGHSMELKHDTEDSFDGYEDDDGNFHFTKFSFRAACILGDEYKPAMTGSTVEVQFTMANFVKNLQNELSDKYTEFTKLANMKTDKGGTKEMPKMDFLQTVIQQVSDISAIVEQHEIYMDKYGWTYPRYYLVDIQENEVIVTDAKDNYRYYGFAFAMNGDKPEIDFSNAVRKKIQYVNYEDGGSEPDMNFNFSKHIDEIKETAFQKIQDVEERLETSESEKAIIEANYTSVKAEYEAMKPKYEEYAQAEEQRQMDALNAEKDAKFAEYEAELGETPDFAALKERKSELSAKEIEKECALLYVQNMRTKANFTKNNGTVVIGVPEIHDENGYIETRYGRIPVKR